MQGQFRNDEPSRKTMEYDRVVECVEGGRETQKAKGRILVDGRWHL